MDLDDFKQPEVAVTAAATAVLLSPAVRRLIRQGAVYGVSGVLLAGDALAAAGRGAARGFQSASGGDGGATARQADGGGEQR